MVTFKVCQTQSILQPLRTTRIGPGLVETRAAHLVDPVQDLVHKEECATYHQMELIIGSLDSVTIVTRLKEEQHSQPFTPMINARQVADALSGLLLAQSAGELRESCQAAQPSVLPAVGQQNDLQVEGALAVVPGAHHLKSTMSKEGKLLRNATEGFFYNESHCL